MKFRHWAINVSAFFGMGVFLILCWLGIIEVGKWAINFFENILANCVCYW